MSKTRELAEEEQLSRGPPDLRMSNFRRERLASRSRQCFKISPAYRDFLYGLNAVQFFDFKNAVR